MDSAVKTMEHFPSVAQALDLVRELRRSQMPMRPLAQFGVWQSTRAPGTPAWAEALFDMIEQNRTESGAFKFVVRSHRLTDDQVLEMYHEWCEGRVHPLSRSKAPDLAKAIVSAKNV